MGEGIKAIVRLICFIVLLVLCIAVYMNGQVISCDKCVVSFTSSLQGVSKVTNVSVMDLYDKLNRDICYVKWNSISGYYLQDEFTINK
jgi:hypothetical protein